MKETEIKLFSEVMGENLKPTADMTKLISQLRDLRMSALSLYSSR